MRPGRKMIEDEGEGEKTVALVEVRKNELTVDRSSP
jgi:hypothetical protein